MTIVMLNVVHISHLFTDQNPKPSGQTVLFIDYGATPPQPVSAASKPEGKQHSGAFE
jgi:hypothetical protein